MAYLFRIPLSCLGLALCCSLPAQDLPTFRYWQRSDSLVVARGLGENLYQVAVPGGGDTLYHAPATLAEQLPDSLAEARRQVYDQAGRQLVLLHDGDLYYLAAGTAGVRRLTRTASPEQNPVFSPDGSRLAYTRAGNLYLYDLYAGTERPLTSDGGLSIYNGYASWVYYTEILGRASRYRAFYWSPDSRAIAFLRFDDQPVPQYPIFHPEQGDSVHGRLEMTRYPKAGDALPRVSLHLVAVDGAPARAVPLTGAWPYVARVQWAPDGQDLYFQRMNREQDSLLLLRYDPRRGVVDKVLEETRTTWVHFGRVRFLEGSDRFLWRSDRSGWQNLYLYDREGNEVAQLTDLDWDVRSIQDVDVAGGHVYFVGSGPVRTDRHLFRVRLDGDSLRQLTRGPGHHRTFLSPDFRYFADRHSRHDDPGALSVYDSTGALVLELGRADRDPNREAGVFVEHFSIPLDQGEALSAYWVLPPGFDPTQPHPLLFDIYGGPGNEAVHDRWRDYTRDGLVQNGVIRFVVDHRGSGKFGRAGLDQLHRQLGKWEIHDYTRAVEWLREQTFVDASRIGIRGGSYGGYLAALALVRAPGYFTHAVARAPVTDWRLYENVYTERYMDRPEANPDGYRDGSVVAAAGQLRGKLLLIHGSADDNVHLQHTLRLASRLQELGKAFELMIYPGARHGWRGPKRRHANQLEEDFFLNNFYGNQGGAQ